MEILPLAGNQEIQISVFEIKPFAEIEISQCAFEEIDAATQMNVMPKKIFKPSFITSFDQ